MSAKQNIWDEQKNIVDTTQNIDELRILARQIAEERSQFGEGFKIAAGMYSDKSNNELMSAIKALEQISMKGLELAKSVTDNVFKKGE